MPASSTPGASAGRSGTSLARQGRVGEAPDSAAAAEACMARPLALHYQNETPWLTSHSTQATWLASIGSRPLVLSKLIMLPLSSKRTGVPPIWLPQTLTAVLQGSYEPVTNVSP